MTIPKAANDNGPRHAGEFAENLEARRSWLDSLPDNAEPVLAWPTLERLAHRGNEAACRALLDYRNLMAPDADILAVDSYTGTEDDPADFSVSLTAERHHEITPNVKRMLAASLRVSFVRYSDGSAERSHAEDGGVSVCRGTTGSEHTLRLGDLRFSSDGQLLAFRDSKRPNWREPVDRQSREKGIVHANDNRHRCDVSRPSGNASKSATGHTVVDEVMRRFDRKLTLQALGSLSVVMDIATSDAVARNAGEVLGYHGKYAERVGVAKIKEAIERFQKIAA
jgi:hypothetical protein